LEPKFWGTLVTTLGLDPATTPHPYDAANHPGLTELLSGIFKAKTRDEWAAVFESDDACVAPVLTLAEAPLHPHNAERGSYIEVGPYTVAAPPIRFSVTPAVASATIEPTPL